MPDPTNPTPAQPTPAVLPAAEPTPPAPPAQSPQQPASQTKPATFQELPDGKVQVLSTKAYKELRESGRRQGREAYKAELDKAAQDRGFANHEALLTHLDTLRASQPQVRNGKPGQQARGSQPAQQPQRQAEPQQQPRPTRHDRQALREAERLSRENRQLSKQNRLLRRRMDAEAAAAQLARIAMGVGVKDVDYAIELYKRAQSGKTEEEQAKMDEAKFFSGLRKTHPLLFNEVEVPATTGTAGEVPGTAPAPTPAAVSGQVVRANGANGAGAMALSKVEFSRHMRSKGIRGFSTGLG